MIGIVRFLVALAFIVVGLLVGLLDAELGMGALVWLVAAIAVELLPIPSVPRARP